MTQKPKRCGLICRRSWRRSHHEGCGAACRGPRSLMAIALNPLAKASWCSSASRGDGFEEANWMAHRIARLRVFPDASQKMRHAVIDHGFDVLVISQFTLLADASAGHRPSFVSAAPPEVAEPLYEHVVQQLQEVDGVGSVKECSVNTCRWIWSTTGQSPSCLSGHHRHRTSNADDACLLAS